MRSTREDLRHAVLAELPSHVQASCVDGPTLQDGVAYFYARAPLTADVLNEAIERARRHIPVTIRCVAFDHDSIEWANDIWRAQKNAN
jgi:hypothetical protein